MPANLRELWDVSSGAPNASDVLQWVNSRWAPTAPSWESSSSTRLLPPGVEIAFAGPSANAPAGWLVSDGSAVSRATYAALYAAIGTTWGAGDGSTTFNLPDRRAKFLKGVNGGNPGATGGAANHTPAGTVAAPVFTGNAATLTGSVASPVISWPAGVPTFAGTNFTRVAGGSGGINSFPTDTKPAGTVAWPAGVPTNTAPALTMNSYTPAGTNSAPAFTGASANYEPAWGDTIWIIKT